MWQRLHEAAGVTGRNKNDRFRELFRQLIRQIDVKLFLEIGAHEAAFSRELADFMPETRIIAYEANPFVYEKYKSQLPETIGYVNSAVGVDNSPKRFYIPRSIPTGRGDIKLSEINTTSSLRARAGQNVVQDEVVCQCTTIDSIMEENNWLEPCALWVDVEGAVGDVLFGSHRALRRNITMIFVEVETNSTWAGQWLASDVIEYLTTKNFIPAVRDCETKWQYNQIYIHDSYLDQDVLKLIENYFELLIKKATLSQYVQV